MKHNGTLNVTKENIKYAQSLTSCGDLDVRADLKAPALTRCDYLDVRADFKAPALTSCGYLDVRADFKAPALTRCGKLRVYADFKAPLLTSCGNLDVMADFKAPLLTSCGDLRVYADLEAPALRNAKTLYIKNGVNFDYSNIEFEAGRVLCVSEYALHYKNGLFTAGCREKLTKEQALAHWGGRTDARALMFVDAIKGV